MNNAANALTEPIGGFTEAGFDKSVDVNIKGPVFLTQEALPHLRASDHASVINVVSAGAWLYSAFVAMYAAGQGGDGVVHEVDGRGARGPTASGSTPWRPARSTPTWSATPARSPPSRWPTPASCAASPRSTRWWDPRCPGVGRLELPHRHGGARRRRARRPMSLTMSLP